MGLDWEFTIGATRKGDLMNDILQTNLSFQQNSDTQSSSHLGRRQCSGEWPAAAPGLGLIWGNTDWDSSSRRAVGIHVVTLSLETLIGLNISWVSTTVTISSIKISCGEWYKSGLRSPVSYLLCFRHAARGISLVLGVQSTWYCQPLLTVKWISLVPGIYSLYWSILMYPRISL